MAPPKASTGKRPLGNGLLAVFKDHTASRVALAVTVVLLLSFGAMLWLMRASQNEADAADRAAHMTLVGSALSSALDRADDFALALAETMARRDAVIAALAANDRKTLQQLSQGTYDYLKQKAGVQIFGFHTTDIRYLLRMHNLDMFDDDVSGSRPMVVAANKSRRAQTGLEIGTGGAGLRGIAVVNKGSDFVGTLEVGLDIKPILEAVKSSTNADLAVVLVQSMSSGVTLNDKLPRFGDLALSESTDTDLFSSLLKNSKIRPSRDIQIADQQIDGRPYNMIAHPLVDFSGRLIGMTLAVTEDSRATSRRLRIDLWVLAGCGGILAYIAFAVLFHTALRQRRSA
ncbi:MAG: cache domain-containing protein [Pseudolabrys sp.]|nr:cache domain-containing protein [Pseudolabrys sp.]